VTCPAADLFLELKKRKLTTFASDGGRKRSVGLTTRGRRKKKACLSVQAEILANTNTCAHAAVEQRGVICIPFFETQ